MGEVEGAGLFRGGFAVFGEGTGVFFFGGEEGVFFGFFAGGVGFLLLFGFSEGEGGVREGLEGR